jgi:hypothetical protein
MDKLASSRKIFIPGRQYQVRPSRCRACCTPIASCRSAYKAGRGARECEVDSIQHISTEANSYQEQHDEVVSQDSINEYGPSRQEPREIVIYNLSGGILDAICLDACCQKLAPGGKALRDN